MIKPSKQWLAHFVCTCLSVAALAGSWDVWWHMVVVRDTFFEPPHVLLYGSAGMGILAGIYGWYVFRNKKWAHLATILSIIPLGAPFDDWWHIIFGVENLASPLIVWSPPHLILIIGLGGAFIMLLQLIKEDRDIILHEFFISLIFAALIGLGYFLVGPLQPFENQHLWGFWGAGGTAFVISFLTLWAQKDFLSPLTATHVAMIFTLFALTNIHASVSPRLIIQSHPHLPNWIYIFSFVFPAVVIDLIQKKALIVKGTVIAVLYGGVFYGASYYFVEYPFQFSVLDTSVAIISCLLGGLLAGFGAKLFLD